MDETIMNELNYLPEYESLKMIPNDQWLLFVTLKYRKDIPTNSKIIKDVMKWLERPIHLRRRAPGVGKSRKRERQPLRCPYRLKEKTVMRLRNAT